jgi:dTDP-4-amino-4,6-dideoxygalactose transaminase
MLNLNFASNENFTEAKKALTLLFQKKQWREGLALEQLQEAVAEKFTVEKNQVFFTLAARSALYLFLKSLNLTKNSEVLVQAFTCEAVVLPVLAADLIPNYVDIEEESWSMDFDDLTKKIGQKSRVLILQHSFAMLPRDRKKILQFSKTHNLIVIEDLAHGFAPELLSNQSYPSSKLLSFGRSKFFNAVFGGAIVVEKKLINQQFADDITQLEPVNNRFISQALLYKILTPVLKSTYTFGGKLFHALFNYLGIFNKEISKKEKMGNYDKWLNKTLPNVFAKLLIDQFSNYQKIYSHRQQIARLYWQEFPQEINKDNLPSLRYPLLIDQAELFLAKMAKEGYVLGNWYRQVVAPPELDLIKVKYQEGSCPQAEKISQEVVNLPLNISLKEAKKLLVVLSDVKKNIS